MEIKVGEYIRTFNGLIGKVVELTDSGNYAIRIYNGAEYVVRAVIAKHSKNIIDLIEVGDIVHTRDVLNEDIVYIWAEEYLKALKEDLDNGIELIDILTKELYKANCYAVERKEEC